MNNNTPIQIVDDLQKLFHTSPSEPKWKIHRRRRNAPTTTARPPVLRRRSAFLL
jgi:hypothetical protein